MTVNDFKNIKNDPLSKDRLNNYLETLDAEEKKVKSLFEKLKEIFVIDIKEKNDKKS